MIKISKGSLIFNYCTGLMCSILAFICLIFDTSKHLCCDGGNWWISILIWVGCLVFQNLAFLIIFLATKPVEK
jgi:hypothetical protein